MGFITAEREQLTLFGYSLDDFVQESAKSRFIVQLVNKLDLNDLYADYSTQGGDAFDPAVLLATWFLAYSEGRTSTRKLEELCSRDMHYIYVSGHLKPDHTSLSRFRQRHLQRLPGYFVQIVRMGVQEGLSDFKLIAIDGSKLQAGCSSRQNRDAKGLKKDLERVREQISDYLQKCELLDEQEPSGELNEVRQKIEKLRQWEQTLTKREEQLEERRSKLQSKDRHKHKINLIEPDARNQKAVNGKPSAPGYNAQVSVDTDTQLIVAADVSDEPTDQNQFGHQHRKAEATLGADPQRGYVADAGYHSFDELEYIEKEQVDAVLAEPRRDNRGGEETEVSTRTEGPFKRSAFRYEEATDTYHCPAGDRVTYRYAEKKRGRHRRIYLGVNCVGCPLRARCVKSSKPERMRMLVRDEKEGLAEAMMRKSSSAEGLHRLWQRRTSVEPAFGNLKANLGFRRFTLRGMNKVQGEFMLMCIAHNVNKLYGMMEGGSFDLLVVCRELLRRLKASFEDLPEPFILTWNTRGQSMAGLAS